VKNNLRLALAIAVLVAVAAAVAAAMAFAGRDASATTRPDNANARRPAASVEQIRLDRRDSLRHTGCSRQSHRLDANV
jgi:hypothetical protein